MPFNLGRRGATRSYRNQYPNEQDPGVVGPPPDPGGGGGTAPAAPSPITSVTTAYKLIVWGGYGYVYQGGASFTTWKNSMGMVGHAGSLGGQKFLFHAGGQYDSTGGTAVGASGTQYDFQKGYQGLGVASINGGATNLGMFVAGKNAVPGLETYLGWYMHSSVQTNGGNDAAGHPTHPPLGDWFNDTNWALYAGDCGRIAGFVGFMGGTGVTIDQEATSTNNDWYTNPKAGVTAAQQLVQCEARGYQVGQAIFAAFPNCSIITYNWRPPGQYVATTLVDGGSGATPPSGQDQQTQFNYGLMRAMKDAGSTGRFARWETDFYKPTSQATVSFPQALKVNAERIMAALSSTLPAATRDYIIPRFNVELSQWTGTDGSNFQIGVVGDAGHSPEPLAANQQTTFSQWSMGGRRWEYMGPTASPDGIPSSYHTATVNNAYLQNTATPNPPGQHAPGMLTASTSAAHPNTTAPTLAASASGTGATRTLTATASHAYGMAWCRAYVYPSGPVTYLSGTWNNGGGSQSQVAGYPNSFVSYNGTITAALGQYIVVQAQSIMGHQKSVVVSAGGTAPFRLYASTSLWNTDKRSPTPTFDADADATLSSLAYGINNGAFGHPFFIGTASDPTWTVTSTEDHWGFPPRTVTMKAPVGIFHASGSDGVMTIFDQTTGICWDFYGSPTINAGAHTVTGIMLADTDGVNGPGFGDQNTLHSAGTTAAGCPQASGTILASDVNAGQINHGLFMAFDYNNSGGVNTSGASGVPPAVFNDVGGAPGPIPQGGLMLVTGTMPAGLNAMEQVLWNACATYGVYNCDSLSGHPQFYGDCSTVVGNAFTDAGLTAIGQRLRLVRTSW